MTIADDLRLALIQADPRLSKFNPLPRILFYDDFDEGVHGWAELIGNHDGNLDNIRPIMADLRPPQLSSCTFFDIGTHGSVHGTYALKLATRAKANHMAQLIKRLTFVRQGLVQFETYFTYKAEQVFSRAKGDAALGRQLRPLGDGLRRLHHQQRRLRRPRRHPLPLRPALPQHRRARQAGAEVAVQDIGPDHHQDASRRRRPARRRLPRAAPR